jgi:peroxiredoxin
MGMRAVASFALIASALALAACSRPTADAAPPPADAKAPASPPASPLADPSARAEVGKPAPDFTLTDLDGKSVSLHDAKGKLVVLEWFNPGCPFVKKSHSVGSLKDLASKHTAQGVVWLAINSSAEGKQGYGNEANADAKKTFAMAHPVLLDPTGAVGRAYGATNTPHMMVVDASGSLVYRGAIDNSPDGEMQSPTDGKLVNYVDAAIDALKGTRDVAVKETKAYGCSVKYASAAH